MEVAELKMLRFSLGVTRMDKIRNEYSTSEGQHRWESLERKLERQDWDGMDTYGGKMIGVLGEGCWGWSCQERGNGEGQKGGLWMWWKRTWLRLKWRRKIQLIETTGEGKSAVATPDGKKPKEEEDVRSNYIQCLPTNDVDGLRVWNKDLLLLKIISWILCDYDWVQTFRFKTWLLPSMWTIEWTLMCFCHTRALGLSRDAVTLDMTGVFYFNTHQTHKALQLFTAAARKDPSTPHVLVHHVRVKMICFQTNASVLTAWMLLSDSVIV